MDRIRNSLSKFIASESGATAIEYALLATGIAVAIVTVVGEVGDQVLVDFELVKDAVD